MKKITINCADDLGPALRAFRESKEYKIVPMSKESGISTATISLVEQNKQHPRVDTLISYAKSLGVREIVIKIPKEETV